MIRPDLHAAALQAIQQLMIWGRYQIECGVSQKKLHSLFDDAEYLVGRMLTAEDDSQVFIEYLEETSERFQCRGVYERFAQSISVVAA